MTPIRNITRVEKQYVAGAPAVDTYITVKTCYENGEFLCHLVFVNGSKLKEYRTDRGLRRYLDVLGAVESGSTQVNIDGPNYGAINM